MDLITRNRQVYVTDLTSKKNSQTCHMRQPRKQKGMPSTKCKDMGYWPEFEEDSYESWEKNPFLVVHVETNDTTR